MMSRHITFCRACIFSLLALSTSQIIGGNNNNQFRNNSVGGISIDANGVVANADSESRVLLLREMRANFNPASPKMAELTELRMISLRGLEAAIADAVQNNQGALPDEVKYLAGLQRIQYILVYPEINDIILAGPGEGWEINDNLHVVGVTTGLPVLQLDNLLTALRAVNAPTPQRISCSIDPTQQGVANYAKKLQQLSRAGVRNPQILAPQLKQAMGNQVVSINGVPGSSHFARVMLAADIRMKQIAMEINGHGSRVMPGFISGARNSVSLTNPNINPRWWLACNYKSVATDGQGLAWEIRGQGVKAMTETEVLQGNNGPARAQQQDPAAQRWADMMTDRYDNLSKADPVFGELRNIMDMCVAAAIIRSNSLLDQADLKLPHLLATTKTISHRSWFTPKHVSTQTSFIKSSRGLVITASGGVDIDYLAPLKDPQVTAEVKQVWNKVHANTASMSWWN
jgi:hypothetical protein